ncbi:ATP-grasp domain-containing protein [Archaeoglobus sp.]
MIFVFEYTSCANDVKEISEEGYLMFKTLIESKLKPKFFVREDIRNGFPTTKNWKEDFKKFLEECEYSLIVAPENEMLLYNLTKIADNLSENLCSKPKALHITSDKWKLYKKLKGNVNTPKTSLKPLDCRFVVKPRVGCDGCGIKFSEDVPEGYIAQEFIEGMSVSVSLLVGEDVHVLSTNRQIIRNFRFAGFETPYQIPKDAVDEALKVVDCIDGLHGYVGIDLILSDQPYVVDVNARLTTPCIAFKKVYNLDLLEVLYLNHVQGSVNLDLNPREVVRYEKKLL